VCRVAPDMVTAIQQFDEDHNEEVRLLFLRLLAVDFISGFRMEQLWLMAQQLNRLCSPVKLNINSKQAFFTCYFLLSL